jgi:hypothetical protein
MDEKIIVAVVSGMFALLGGFVGAWLVRRTEYEKWLRQQRSIAFSDFITQLHQIRKIAVDVIYDTTLSEQQRDIKMTELFCDLNSQENIVRFYLKRCDREKFSSLKTELWAIYSPNIEQATRLKKVESLLSQIQAIFENTLHS